MISTLKEKLLFYVVENNPDLVIGMQKDYSLAQFLDDKIEIIKPMVAELSAEHRPPYLIEQLCMQTMTEQLRPSRFSYIRSVLESEFPEDFYKLEVLGIINYEIMNLLEECKKIFDEFSFSQDHEDDQSMRNTIIGQVHEYLSM